MKRVTDLYVQCSFDLRTAAEKRRGPTCASDTCRAHATSAVRRGDDLLWRCGDHEGRVDWTTNGGVVREVQR